MLAARLAALEDANAIRALQQRYARLVSAGARTSSRRCSPTRRAQSSQQSARSRPTAMTRSRSPPTAPRRRASACTVETATPIESCGTLVEMARLQGDGFVEAQRAARARRARSSSATESGNSSSAELASMNKTRSILGCTRSPRCRWWPATASWRRAAQGSAKADGAGPARHPPAHRRLLAHPRQLHEQRQRLRRPVHGRRHVRRLVRNGARRRSGFAAASSCGAPAAARTRRAGRASRKATRIT